MVNAPAPASIATWIAAARLRTAAVLTAVMVIVAAIAVTDSA